MRQSVCVSFLIALLFAMATAAGAGDAQHAADAPEASTASWTEVGIDLAEYRFEDSDHSILLESSASWGDDTDRVVAKLDGGGSVGRRLHSVDTQLLWSHAIGKDIAVLGGIRHEFRPHPHATYAVLGIEGSASPELAMESYFFLSEDGKLTGEVKAVYEREIVPKLVLQPRAALSYAAEAVPEQGLASGFTDAELAVRLRYEPAGQFAPYIGVSHMRLLGGTKDIARAAGDVIKATDFVVGFSVSF